MRAGGRRGGLRCPATAAGTGVDAAGWPVGFVAVCESRVGGLTLCTEDGHGGHPYRQRLDAGPPHRPRGWPAGPELVPGGTYVLCGRAEDGSRAAAPVGFTLAGLESPRPGHVSFRSGGDPAVGLPGAAAGKATESPSSGRGCRRDRR